MLKKVPAEYQTSSLRSRLLARYSVQATAGMRMKMVSGITAIQPSCHAVMAAVSSYSSTPLNPSSRLRASSLVLVGLSSLVVAETMRPLSRPSSGRRPRAWCGSSAIPAGRPDCPRLVVDEQPFCSSQVDAVLLAGQGRALAVRQLQLPPLEAGLAVAADGPAERSPVPVRIAGSSSMIGSCAPAAPVSGAAQRPVRIIEENPASCWSAQARGKSAGRNGPPGVVAGFGGRPMCRLGGRRYCRYACSISSCRFFSSAL